eukprot:2011920-Alexandrium_andersonii.AAC.1
MSAWWARGTSLPSRLARPRACVGSEELCLAPITPHLRRRTVSVLAKLTRCRNPRCKYAGLRVCCE